MVCPCIYIRTLGVCVGGGGLIRWCAVVVRGSRATTQGVSHTCSVQYYLSVDMFVVTAGCSVLVCCDISCVVLSHE